MSMLRRAMTQAAEIQAQHGGVLITYQPKDGGPTITDMPAVFGAVETEEASGPPGRSRIMTRRTLLITVEALGPTLRPQRDDLIGLGSEGGWRVASARLEESGVRYVVSLTRQD